MRRFLPAAGFVFLTFAASCTNAQARALPINPSPNFRAAQRSIGFLAGSYVLNHRARYRPGARKTFAARLIGSVNSLADPRTHTLGASVEIPLGR
jgi:hypothetical protein